MEKSHPNVAVIEQFNPADIIASEEVIAEDAVFHYFNPRLPDLRGDYQGRKGFFEFFGKIETLTNGTFKVTPISIVPMGDEFVVTYVKNSMSFGDNQVKVEAVVVWRIVEGKIIEAWDIPAVHTATTS